MFKPRRRSRDETNVASDWRLRDSSAFRWPKTGDRVTLYTAALATARSASRRLNPYLDLGTTPFFRDHKTIVLPMLQSRANQTSSRRPRKVIPRPFPPLLQVD